MSYSEIEGMRILVVEDDPELAGMLERILASAGFLVDYAMDGRAGLRKALSVNYSLIVLDLMLPQIDGLKMCAEFRGRRGTTPVLMITARNSVADRVMGLETGADDYLPKPFDVREFLARVRALIRRDRVLKARDLRIGSIKIDTKQRKVTVEGKVVSLTRLEYGILEILAGQVGQTVFRETLLELVWQDREPGSNKLEVAMRSLRRKLQMHGLDGLIQTIYGVGYTLCDEASAGSP